MRAADRENSLYRKGKKILFSHEERYMFQFLDRFVEKGSNVLDVGCGTGEISEKLIELGHTVRGVDFSQVAIDICLNKELNATVVDLDECIPFTNDEFEVVWAGDVIEHVFDPIGLFDEMSRVLSPSGILLFTIPYDLHISNRIRMLFGTSYQEPIYKKHGQCKHHTFFTDGLAEYMMSRSGFELLDKVFVNRIPLLNKKFSSRQQVTKFVGQSIVYACRNTND